MAIKAGAGFNATNATADNSIGYVVQAATLRRTGYYDFTIGATAAGDNVAGYGVNFVTAEAMTPAGTNVPEVALDQEATSETPSKDVVQAPTGQPTHGADEVIEVGLNERATYRWVAAPGGELIVAANADDGITFEVDTAPAAGFNTSIFCHWWE